MPTPDMFSGPPAPDPPRWPNADLYEEMVACHDEWREEIATVDEAYRRWCTAPTDEREDRFCAYIAALDQEEAAAEVYAEVLAELKASLSEQEDLSPDPPIGWVGDVRLGAAWPGCGCGCRRGAVSRLRRLLEVPRRRGGDTGGRP